MIEQYIVDYAEAKKKEIKSDDLMLPVIKEYFLSRINRVVKLRSTGILTVDETMQDLSNC